MTEIKTYCDHCGKLLGGMVDYNEITVEAAHKFIRPDLCCDCFEKLWDMISEFCEAMKQDENSGNDVLCDECEYLMFSDCYGECRKGYKGIVNPNDSCGKGKRKEDEGK